jgi:two-component system chemotaxis sensor kinase CheA
MDNEMKEIFDSFAAECAEHIRKATDCILLIEDRRDEEALNGLFRAFHTIKGNARMLEFQDIGELAHAAENVMARLRNGTLARASR